MSKGKSNSFLTGYFAVVGLGTLGLGYLAWSASSSSDEAQQSYESSRSRLEGMQRAAIFPNAENEAKKKKLVDETVAKVKALVDQMLQYRVPLNPAETGESFQKKLVAANAAITQAAKERKVALGEKFSLGFDKYSDTFASPGTAAVLAAELDAVTFLLNTAMASGVAAIDNFRRGELEIEKAPETPAAAPPSRPGAPPKPTPAASRPGAPGAKPGPGKTAAPVVEESKVLERMPMALTLTGSNLAIKDFLVALANAKPADPATGTHFFAIRMLRAESSVKDGPDKAQTVTAEEKEDPETKTVIKRDARFILGDEKVTVLLDLDLIRPLEPETAAATGTKPAPAAAQ